MNTIATLNPVRRPQLSIPIQPIMIQIDGQWLADLKIIRISRYPGCRLNHAILKGGLNHIRTIQQGQAIKILCWIGFNKKTKVPICWPLFTGTISEISHGLSRTEGNIEIIAVDQLKYLNQSVIDKINSVTTDHIINTVESDEICFNPSGIPNRSEKVFNQAYGQSYLFDMDPDRARYWSYTHIIQYILANAVIGLPNTMTGDEEYHHLFSHLDAIVSSSIPESFSIGQLTVLEALEKACHNAGIQFCLEEYALRNDRFSKKLAFYRERLPLRIVLAHQLAGESFDPQKTNIIEYDATTSSVKLLHIRGDIYPGCFIHTADSTIATLESRTIREVHFNFEHEWGTTLVLDE